jgi:23S rRNA (cytosine1962-C5)-methyltransferase
MEFNRIKLKRGKDASLKRGHPWVFSGAIESAELQPLPGDIVEVRSHQGEYLGHGHWSEGSIAIRLFSFSGYSGEEEFWLKKLSHAVDLRKRLGFVGNHKNNIYRLVHAEGDGLPGIIIDVYDSVAVIQAHSKGMHAIVPILAKAIFTVLGDKVRSVYDKSSAQLRKHADEEMTDGFLLGDEVQGVTGVEHGHNFYIDFIDGQKTGFFIDQRENRKLLTNYVEGKKVLNTFCYSGGFSVYAKSAGATLVHSLDSSQKALDLTAQNFELNEMTFDTSELIRADAVEYLKAMENDYDVIVLDPPAFAKQLSARHKAVQGYMRINEAAMRHMKSGGILFTFSCSQAVDKQLFYNTLVASAIQAKRGIRILHQLHQPPDHPVSIFHPEGEYLKGFVLEIS